MFDEATNVLFQVKRFGFVPHIFTYNFLMNHLIEHGKMNVVVAIYKWLNRNGLRPNGYTYTIVIKALCKNSLEEVYNVF